MSFTAGQYLPCVTTSPGITTVAPLAIFIVFAVAALFLIAYLIKFIVSNKKEVALNRGALYEEQQTKKLECSRFC